MDTLVNKIIKLSQEQPDKTAVAFKKEKLTYKQLFDKVLGIAYVLKKEGVQSGDRICFLAVSRPEMVAVYLAVQFCGAVAVFMDKNGTLESLAYIYHETNAKLLISDKPMNEYSKDCTIMSLRKLYQEADEQKIDDLYPIIPETDALAELLFTSGTTGTPKGVKLTFKSVYNIFSNTIEGIGIQKEDILLLPLPLHHSFALRVLRSILYQGATVVLQNGFTFAKEIENNVMAYNCNSLACVPTSYEIMKSQMQDAFSSILGNMRFIEFGAGSLSIKQRTEITKLLPRVTIYNTWGSSESGGAIFCNVTEVVKDKEKIGALGKPLSGKVDIKILDMEGHYIESNVDHPGRMAIHGDMQMTGYWNNPEATSAALVDGWLLTGDLAYIQDGYVYMLGRADDIINVGGEKVSPIEVENIAGMYEGIKECACIGVEDLAGIAGQIPVLFLVARACYSENDLQKFLASKLERFKIPQKYIVLESIPRNQMQKIDRKELRRIWEHKDTLELMNPVMQNILSRHSIRNFKEDEVPSAILDMILKAGYYAQSGLNMQSWRFTVLTQKKDIMELKEKSKIAADQNKVHFYGFNNPKVLILISNDKRNPDGCQDASCAAENILLAANSYGLGAVWLNPLMTLRNVEPVKEVLDKYKIPENHIIWASIALGYPLSDGAALVKKTDVVYYV